MKGFALNEQGDLLIENGAIQMVHGAELTKQTIKTILETQKGEWFLNWDEGIDHKSLLGKNRPEDEVIKAEIQDGLSQVDENLIVDNFETVYESKTRKLCVHFVVVNKETAEKIDINETLN